MTTIILWVAQAWFFGLLFFLTYRLVRDWIQLRKYD